MAALDELEMPTDGASLAVAVRAYDRYEARLAVAIAAFDESGEWEIAGHTSVVAWLRDLGFTHGDAAQLVKIGQKLRRLPVTAAAWVSGRLSGGQVRVICAKVIDRHVELFAEHEALVVPSLASLDMIETAVAMRVWRDRADALDEGARPKDPRAEAWLSSTLDDRGQLNASLDAEGFALAVKALALADSGDLDEPAPQRRGAALVDVFRFFVDNQNLTHPGRNRPHLNLIINADTIDTDRVEGYDLTTGMSLTSESLERLLCDCTLHRVLNAESTLLDYGVGVRTPPPELWNGIVIRDRGCRWRNCDRPASWCHAHHVNRKHCDGGSTSLDNLVLLCEKHHGMLHRNGWHARLHPDGTLEVTGPNLIHWTTRPPGAIGPPPTPPRDDGDDDQSPFERHVEEMRLRELIRARARALVA